ncbi:MAG: FtsB family cell division protein [Brevinematia bacterium]
MNQKLTLVITGIISLLTILLIFSFTFSKGGIIDTIEKEKKIYEMEKQVKELKIRNKAKQEQLEMLKKDQDYRKSLAKGLGVEVNDSEYVFRFNNYSDNKTIQNKTEYNIQNISTLLLWIFIIQTILIIMIFFKSLREN